MRLLTALFITLLEGIAVATIVALLWLLVHLLPVFCICVVGLIGLGIVVKDNYDKLEYQNEDDFTPPDAVAV